MTPFASALSNAAATPTMVAGMAWLTSMATMMSRMRMRTTGPPQTDSAGSMSIDKNIKTLKTSPLGEK